MLLINHLRFSQRVAEGSAVVGQRAVVRSNVRNRPPDDIASRLRTSE